MAKLSTKQLEALRWLATNDPTPAGAGGNVSRHGATTHIAHSTLASLEARDLVSGRIGNDGARWYFLTDAGFKAGQE